MARGCHAFPDRVELTWMIHREIREARETVNEEDNTDMIAGCRGNAPPRPIFMGRAAWNFLNGRAFDFAAFRVVRGCMNCTG